MKYKQKIYGYSEGNTVNCFSVIIPVFNAGQYIGQYIHSVLSQNYSNYEIIVIDDGSDDMTKKLIQKPREKLCIMLKSICHSGAGAVRNVGLHEAFRGIRNLFGCR